jgi:DNA repair exonuclease SbcCD nuclease subunit
MLSSRKAETVELTDLGVAIHGRGFASPQVADNVVNQYPARRAGWFNIGVLHTSLDSESDGEHARYAPCRIDDLRQKEYDYWALGHIHTRAIRHRDPPIVYPGNLQGRHVRETGPKGCMVVSVDDAGTARSDFVPVDVFRWELCVVDASGLTSTDDLLSECAAQLSALLDGNDGLPLAVRIMLTGRTAAHQHLAAELSSWTNQMRAMALDVSGGKLWLEKVKSKTRPPRAATEAALSDGPMSELLRQCRELHDSHELLDELAAELADFKRKLPDELRHGEDSLALDDPDRLREMLADVQALLVGRLAEEV